MAVIGLPGTRAKPRVGKKGGAMRIIGAEVNPDPESVIVMPVTTPPVIIAMACAPLPPPPTTLTVGGLV